MKTTTKTVTVTIAPIPVEPQTFESELETITIPAMSQEEILASTGYDCVNSNIEKTKLIHEPGIKLTVIWHANRYISTNKAVDEIDRMTINVEGRTLKGRPAKVLELAQYRAIYHRNIKKIRIVALGEKILDDSHDCFACHCFDTLELFPLSDDWFWEHRFLVVFEEVLETK